jgi:hypothetical protein
MLVKSRPLDVRDLRIAGACMLAAGMVRPWVGNPGIPCPLRTLTGIPCPLCGMTTSVTATEHLHLGSALGANPGGIVAVIVAIALLAAPRVTTVPIPPWVIPVGLGLLWLFELFRFSIL